MSELYRLEACEVCGVIRKALWNINKERQEQQSPRDTYIEGIRIYTVPFCPSCQQQFDEAQAVEEERAKETCEWWFEMNEDGGDTKTECGYTDGNIEETFCGYCGRRIVEKQEVKDEQ